MARTKRKPNPNIKCTPQVKKFRHLAHKVTYQEQCRMLAENVSARRREMPMTRRELAAELGVSESHIHELEEGRCMPAWETFLRLSWSLACWPAQLLQMNGFPSNYPEPYEQLQNTGSGG